MIQFVGVDDLCSGVVFVFDIDGIEHNGECKAEADWLVSGGARPVKTCGRHIADTIDREGLDRAMVERLG